MPVPRRQLTRLVAALRSAIHEQQCAARGIDAQYVYVWNRGYFDDGCVNASEYGFPAREKGVMIFLEPPYGDLITEELYISISPAVLREDECGLRLRW